MFFEYAAPVKKSSRVTKRGFPVQGVLERRHAPLSQGPTRSFRGLLKELNRLRQLEHEFSEADSKSLMRLILCHDARIWPQAAKLDLKSQRRTLTHELEQGEISLREFFTLIERLAFLSSEDIPRLLTCLDQGSKDLDLLARRLLGKLEASLIVRHSVLALRDDRKDPIPLINFLGELGADAIFARQELTQRLENWGCPIEEQVALNYALSQIPESDTSLAIAASLNYKEAA